MQTLQNNNTLTSWTEKCFTFQVTDFYVPCSHREFTMMIIFAGFRFHTYIQT